MDRRRRRDRQPQPLDLGDIVGHYARASASRPRRRRFGGRGGATWAAFNIQERAAAAREDRQHDPHQKDESGSSCRARRARPSRRRREVGARAWIFKFFAGEVLRQSGDKVPSCGGRRDRGDARADRRRRHHHAVELPDRDPGVEDSRRRSPTALRGVQPADLVPGCGWRSPRSSSSGIPKGVFNLVMAEGRRG